MPLPAALLVVLPLWRVMTPPPAAPMPPKTIVGRERRDDREERP